MKNNFGIEQRTINELISYFKTKQDIEKVIIFGSRAKGTFSKGSDIDFAILTQNHKQFYKISAELDELPTPYKFDVIDYQTLSHEEIKNSIDSEGIVFYEK